MKKNNTIYGFGSALLDIIVEVPEEIISILGLVKSEMTLVDETHAKKILEALSSYPQIRASGGGTANAIATSAMLGGEAKFTGVVGDDTEGTQYKEHMERDGAETQLSFGDRHTGYAITLVTPDHERTFATFLGAAELLSPEHIVDEYIQHASIIHTEGYLFGEGHKLFETILHGIKIAKEHKTLVSLDVSDAGVVGRNIDQFLNTIRSSVDILFANEDEAFALVGKKGEEALNAIVALGPSKVFLKMGAHGAIASIEGKTYQFAPFSADVQDTTGAGDTFAGVVLHGLTHGIPIEEIGKKACYLSSKIVEKIGARFSKEEVMWHLEALKKLK